MSWYALRFHGERSEDGTDFFKEDSLGYPSIANITVLSDFRIENYRW